MRPKAPPDLSVDCTASDKRRWPATTAIGARPPSNEMRTEYRREDLGKGVRGKYAARCAKASNVVVIDPALTKAFPNSEAVNAALRGLLALATSAVRSNTRAKPPARKRGAGQP